MNPLSTRPNKDRRTIVFTTFETGFAPSGGLAAVMKVLPPEMAKHENCIVLAPYFRHISAPLPTLTTFECKIGSRAYPVEIQYADGAQDLKTYLLSAKGFFTAPADPYVYPDEPENLVRDALFFCAAVPVALLALARQDQVTPRDLVFHLQDWETACVIQAARQHPGLGAHACVLTLHNPYDRYLAPGGPPLVSEIVQYLDLRYDNVLAQMIPLADGPLSTVSANFADELTSDPLHTDVFAPHLQELLASKGVVGVDNGLFGQRAFPFSDEARQEAEGGNYHPIQQEKWDRRGKLYRVLDSFQQELAKNPQPGREAWGEDLDLADPWLPVFLLMGRDDARQKGYDVVAEAIRHIPPGRARYIFTPIPGVEGFAGLDFLKKLAEERPGEVKVFPFRLTPEPFMALRSGSSFMVMGSLYEPFGAANEAYLAGMPLVARATGGLVQQIAPYPGAALSREGRQLVNLFHQPTDEPTGILYREPAVPRAVQGWQQIVDTAYWHQTPRGDRIADRKGSPLFDAMVQRAAWALQDAIELYTTDQEAYARMIYHGYQMLDKFSWDRAIRGYQRLYDRVCK